MCETGQTMEQTTQPQTEPRKDVDDLIFRDEKEWLASDR